MKGSRGRWLTLLTCIFAACAVAWALLNVERMKELWYLGQLRSGDPAARARAAEKLGEMKSLRAVPLLIEEIRRESNEEVEIGLAQLSTRRLGWIYNKYCFGIPPVKRFSGPSQEKDSCILLGPIGHALYSVGSEAIPLVEREVERHHSVLDLEIQRNLDVLEAILRAWKNKGIAVIRKDNVRQTGGWDRSFIKRLGTGS